MQKNKRIFITTGDQDGIGPEVTLKALLKLDSFDEQFFVWASGESLSEFEKKLSSKYSIQKINEEDLGSDSPNANICLIESSLSPAHWVERSAQLCLSNQFHGLVTAPLSKTLIQNAGFKDIGHTQILKRVCEVDNVYMFFIGQHFNVLLATDHIPLQKVSERLNRYSLNKAIEAALHAKKFLSEDIASKPIRVLGLNPHAGEDGLLGDEENQFIKDCVKKFEGQGVVGPEVPDAAFLNAENTSLYVCLYHDQGLIPFKYAHKHKSVHTSLGLPFPRSSVDHGTAKDIFGKGIADSTSMYFAIRLMQQYLKNERLSL